MKKTMAKPPADPSSPQRSGAPKRVLVRARHVARKLGVRSRTGISPRVVLSSKDMVPAASWVTRRHALDDVGHGELELGAKIFLRHVHHLLRNTPTTFYAVRAV